MKIRKAKIAELDQIINMYNSCVNGMLEANIDQETNFILKLKEFTNTRKIFLVDPLGNVILMWPSQFNGKQLLKDLKKLLKHSRIG